MADTRTVYHPTFRTVTREVPKDNEKDWKAAGWRFTPIPEDKAPEPDPDPVEDSE